jgi:hypothetical protein
MATVRDAQMGPEMVDLPTVGAGSCIFTSGGDDATAKAMSGE